MWKSVGSPHRACVLVTSTGTPRAAQTLLKLTPAAMTITSASSGPIEGTSITSSRIASSGSPYRSRRTSCACMRVGTSPTGGISPTAYTSLAMLAPFEVVGAADDRRASVGATTPWCGEPREPQGGRRAALDGQLSERGHHVQ